MDTESEKSQDGGRKTKKSKRKSINQATERKPISNCYVFAKVMEATKTFVSFLPNGLQESL